MKPKLTRWFTVAESQPVHVGYYEGWYDGCGSKLNNRVYYDGRCWRSSPRGVMISFGNSVELFPGDKWRGCLTKQTK